MPQERNEPSTRKVHQWKVAGLSMLVLVVVGAPVSAQTIQYQDIVAKRIIFEDAKGNRRALLGIDEDENATLKLFDKNGKVRMALTVKDDGPGIVLYDKQGKHRAWLNTADDGPALLLYDSSGKHRASLNVADSGPALTLYDVDDDKSRHRAWLHVQNRVPDLVFYDRSGKTVFQATASKAQTRTTPTKSASSSLLSTKQDVSASRRSSKSKIFDRLVSPASYDKEKSEGVRTKLTQPKSSVTESKESSNAILEKLLLKNSDSKRRGFGITDFFRSVLWKKTGKTEKSDQK